MTAVDRHAAGYEPRWDADHEVGRQGELWVQSIVDSLKSDAREVKTDERFADTGNIYVEYECKRRGHYLPSGLSTTEAPVWAFVLQREGVLLVVATDLLKRVARERFEKGRTAECKRGSHPTRGVLVPVPARKSTVGGKAHVTADDVLCINGPTLASLHEHERREALASLSLPVLDEAVGA